MNRIFWALTFLFLLASIPLIEPTQGPVSAQTGGEFELITEIKGFEVLSNLLIQDELLYVFAQNALRIFDIQDIQSPQQIGELSGPFDVGWAQVSFSDHLIARVHNYTITFYDVADPTNPHFETGLSLGKHWLGIDKHTFSGDTHYFLSIEGLCVATINLSLENPYTQDDCNDNFPTLNAYAVSGAIAHFLTGYPPFQLLSSEILEARYVKSPVSEIELVEEGLSLVVNGNYLYVLTKAGLQIFDISVPLTPQSIGFFETDLYRIGGQPKLIVEEDLLYIGGSSPRQLQVLDISNPLSVQEIFLGEFPVHLLAFEIKDGNVLVATSGQVNIYKIAPPNTILDDPTIAEPPSHGAMYSGHLIYVDLEQEIWVQNGQTGARNNITPDSTANIFATRLSLSPSGSQVNICRIESGASGLPATGYIFNLGTNAIQELPENICWVDWLAESQVVFDDVDGIYMLDLATYQMQLLIPTFGDRGISLAHPAPGGGTIGFRQNYIEGLGDYYTWQTGSSQLAAWETPVGEFDWSPDGQQIVFGEIVYAPAPGAGLRVGSIASGAHAYIFQDPEGYAENPIWSPNGEQIAFSVASVGEFGIAEDYRHYLIAPDSAGLVELVGEFDSLIAWGPENNQLLVSSFLDTAGSRRFWLLDLVTGSQTELFSGELAVWSPFVGGGPTELVFVSDRTGEAEIHLLDLASGTVARILNGLNQEVSPVWSPDGRRIAFVSSFYGNDDIYVMQSDGSQVRRLTTHRAADIHPSWSPDGRELAFSSYRDGNAEIYAMLVDAEGPLRRLTAHPADDLWPAWAADGQVAFVSDRGGDQDIYLMDAMGNLLSLLVQASGDDFQPAWSPDSSQLAFTSFRDGNAEVYRLDAAGEVYNLTNFPGMDDMPTWSPAGEQIAFISDRTGNQEIFSVRPDGTDLINLTNHSGDAFFPHWRPAAGGSTNSEVFIAHIEVTQVIQTETNAMPLIAEKPALVRVYISCDQDCDPVAQYYGELTVQFGSNPPMTVYAANSLSGVGSAPWQLARTDLSKSINFYLPSDFLEGTVSFTVVVNGQQRSQTFDFKEAEIPRISHVPIIYQGETPDLSIVLPISQQFFAQLLPTAGAEWHQGIPVNWDACLEGGNPLCSPNAYTLLNQLAASYVMADPAIDFVVGWLPGTTWGGGFSGNIGQVSSFLDAGNSNAPATFVHEYGHGRGLRHSNTWESTTNDPACLNLVWGIDILSDWPYETAEIDDVGIDQLATQLKLPQGVLGSTYDFMSYCGSYQLGNIWISTWNYAKLFNTYFAPEISIPRLYRADMLTGVEQGGLGVGQAQHSEMNFISVSGIVSQSGEVSWDPVWPVPSASSALLASSEGAYCLAAFDSLETILIQRCFPLAFVDVEIGADLDISGFHVLLPWMPEISQVVLFREGIALSRIQSSPSLPEISVGPVSEVMNSVGQARLRVDWTAADADGDALTFALQYSPDSKQWLPLAIDWKENSFELDPAQLPGGDDARLRIWVSDGFHFSLGEIDMNVAQKPPSAHILTAAQSVPFSGHLQVLQGFGYDPEEGNLPGSRLRWTSNLDGVLGHGQVLYPSLSPGYHFITLQVEDRDRNVAVDYLTVSTYPMTGLEITDLRVEKLSEGRVNLVWTVPPDAGAATYDVRYHTEPLHEENWDGAMVLDHKQISISDGQAFLSVQGLPNGKSYLAIQMLNPADPPAVQSNIVLVSIGDDESPSSFTSLTETVPPWYFMVTGVVATIMLGLILIGIRRNKRFAAQPAEDAPSLLSDMLESSSSATQKPVQRDVCSRCQRSLDKDGKYCGYCGKAV